MLLLEIPPCPDWLFYSVLIFWVLVFACSVSDLMCQIQEEVLETFEGDWDEIDN